MSSLSPEHSFESQSIWPTLGSARIDRKQSGALLIRQREHS